MFRFLLLFFFLRVSFEYHSYFFDSYVNFVTKLTIFLSMLGYTDQF